MRGYRNTVSVFVILDHGLGIAKLCEKIHITNHLHAQKKSVCY